jgi:hypothetical protein
VGKKAGTSRTIETARTLSRLLLSVPVLLTLSAPSDSERGAAVQGAGPRADSRDGSPVAPLTLAAASEGTTAGLSCRAPPVLTRSTIDHGMPLLRNPQRRGNKSHASGLLYIGLPRSGFFREPFQTRARLYDRIHGGGSRGAALARERAMTSIRLSCIERGWTSTFADQSANPTPSYPLRL